MSELVRILVIDDSEDDRMLYRRALGKSPDARYDIAEAVDGEEGVALIGERTPDCVLLDYSLPGRNGVEVLKRIRSAYPFVPVVMLTGQGSEAVAVTAIQEGAQNYIAKSAISPETLQRAIRVAAEHCAMRKRIHEQRASLEVFTRALAHDLKEPVRTLRSFLDLIAAHETLSERGQGYFRHVRSAAERMDALIDTVYFYTRLDGTEPPARESCDAARAFEAARENLHELIRARGASIACDPLPAVHASPMQLMQLFQNLLGNAIGHCDVAPVIRVGAEEEEQAWRFCVRDNGPGIAGEYRERIFEPFKRLTHPGCQGLGMGLAICRKIVESHGGKIWCESADGGGAAFLFTLPKAAEKRAARLAPDIAAIRDRVEAGGGALGTILLVEDNDADVELTRIMLIEESRLRCTLLVARDGCEALARLLGPDAAPPDLVLLDINMPGMDGFELLGRMRSEASLRHVPVVMCTTSAYDKDMARAAAMGVAGYLTKPAGLDKLKSIIGGTGTLRLRQDGDTYTLIRAA